jgi:galactokinase
VNLIGDHTDYMNGLAMPIAIDLGTSVRGSARGDTVELTSAAMDSSVSIPIGLDDPTDVAPGWGRYVAGVVAQCRPSVGFVGRVDSTLPPGSGLSSSAALEVAVALALGADPDPVRLAALCQRAEQQATGVPCGIMDQLAITSGVRDHALLLDCATNDVTPVSLPPELHIVVAHSGVDRTLVGSAYADRRAQCEAAEAQIGPLRSATAADVIRIDDPALRRRARHVVSEIQRVRDVAAALDRADLGLAGHLMSHSHASLRDDFDVSTPELDDLVTRLEATEGVTGARLTGAGFGGCAVAIADRPVVLDDFGPRAWLVEASAAAGLR